MDLEIEDNELINIILGFEPSTENDGQIGQDFSAQFFDDGYFSAQRLSGSTDWPEVSTNPLESVSNSHQSLQELQELRENGHVTLHDLNESVSTVSHCLGGATLRQFGDAVVQEAKKSHQQQVQHVEHCLGQTGLSRKQGTFLGMQTQPLEQPRHSLAQPGQPLEQCIAGRENPPISIDMQQSHQQEDDDERCPVCADGFAGRHKYYGGRACHSCRGFFRRSVQSGHDAVYVCAANDDCVILSKSRRSCQACRFKRCLSSGGLRPSSVMSAQQRRDRMLKRTVRERQKRSLTGPTEGTANRTSSTSSSTSSSAVIEKNFLSASFPDDERSLLESRFSVLLEFNHRRHYDFLGSDGGNLLSSFAETIVKGRPFSRRLLQAIFTLDEQSTKGFSLDAVPEMASLRSGSDRVALVSRNFAAVAGLEWAWFVTEGEDTKYLDSFLTYGRRRKRESVGEGPANILNGDDDVSNVVTAMEAVSLENKQARVKQWNMTSLYNLGEKHTEAEQLWQSLVRCLSAGGANREQSGFSSDPVLNILLAMIMLFDPDGGNRAKPLRLENQNAVERVRNIYLNVLARYLSLSSSSTDGQIRLNECMKAASHARRFYNLHLEALDLT